MNKTGPADHKSTADKLTNNQHTTTNGSDDIRSLFKRLVDFAFQRNSDEEGSAALDCPAHEHLSWDRLTGAYSRGYFAHELRRLLAEAEPGETSVALILADIDRLTSINETYGRRTGDHILAVFCEMAAHAVDRCQRDGIISDAQIARIGGEEFAIILPIRQIAQAKQLAERIRKAAEARRIDHVDGHFSFTASFGVATSYGKRDDIDQMLMRAENAAYEAKLQGRNRALMANPLHLVPPQGKSVARRKDRAETLAKAG